MSLVSILALAAVVLGALCFFISGLLAGRRGGGGDQSQLRDALLRGREQQSASQKRLAAVEAERDRAQAELTAAERELTRAAEELGRAETELGQAEGEIERLSLSDLSPEERAARSSKPPPLPFPDPDAKQSNAIDEALSRLRPSLYGDQTEEEIERLKAEADMPTEMPPPPDSTSAPKRDRKGPGFQTVSIASRNTDVPSVEHDRLRAAHDKLKREKDALEDEFNSIRQQLQQLKPRGE